MDWETGGFVNQILLGTLGIGKMDSRLLPPLSTMWILTSLLQEGESSLAP